MADIQQMVDFKHIFQQWNKGEEEQDLGYDTEFGIWIWPQLKKWLNYALVRTPYYIFHTCMFFFTYFLMSFQKVACCEYFLASSTCVGHAFACFLMTKKSKCVNIQHIQIT